MLGHLLLKRLAEAQAEQRRACAGDAECGTAAGERHVAHFLIACNQLAAKRLVQAILQRAGNDGPVACFQCLEQYRRTGHIEHRIGKGHLFGQRTARQMGAQFKVGDQRRKAQLRMQGIAHCHRGAVVHIGGHQTAQQGRRQVVGMALDVVADTQQFQRRIGRAVERIGGRRTGGDHGGGRAEAAADGNVGLNGHGQAGHRQAHGVHHLAIGHYCQILFILIGFITADKNVAGGRFLKG